MKGILLISSGIDSPVAGHLMQKLELIGVNYTFNNKINDVVIELAQKIGLKKIYFVNIAKLHENFNNNSNTKYQCVFCKRSMLRIAEIIANKENCDFIINGSNLGQVASQTLSNIVAVDSAVDLTVLRPLLCYDKQEIVNIAKEIGTYKDSIKQNKKCPMLPSKVATRTKLSYIQKQEENINLNDFDIFKIVELKYSL